MTGFRDIKTPRGFAAAHALIHKHFNHQRPLNRRDSFKQDRTKVPSSGVNLLPERPRLLALLLRAT